MLTSTTVALSYRLAEAMDSTLRKVAICSSEHLVGRMKTKGIPEDLPAMAIERTNITVDRESRIRTVAGIQGIPIINNLQAKGHLQVLPVRVTYSIAFLTKGREERDKLETNLLWLLQDGDKLSMTIPIVIEDQEASVIAEVTPSSPQNVSFGINRREEWEEFKVYQTEFELEVNTYLIKYKEKPIITSVNWKIIEDEITLAEGIENAD